MIYGVTREAREILKQKGGETMATAFGNKSMPATYAGKSTKLGGGGRAAKLKSEGVPGGVIGNIAREKGAAPGGPNYKGKRK